MEISPANARNIDAYDGVGDDALRGWDPEGDSGRKYLLNPTIFRMIGDLADVRILDAGCGQGYLSRLLAASGATVVGVEPSTRFLAYAQQSERERPLGVRYFQRDLSRLGDLGESLFDVVVANMVLLDIADWTSAMVNCLSVLRPGGDFIFSLLHPCWTHDATDTWATTGRVEISEYLHEYEVAATWGVNYHRPLSTYLRFAATLGASVVEIAEPILEKDDAPDNADDVRRHIPNFIVISVRSKGVN